MTTSLPKKPSTMSEPATNHEIELATLLMISALEREHPVGEKGFTKADVRKMIAKSNEELAIFESREEARLATPH
jgi:hypothetical protein